MKKRRLKIGSIKKAKVTQIPDKVEDLLASSDVNDILEDLNKLKPHISDLLVIYVDRRTGRWSYECNDDLLTSKAVWLLESVKFDFIQINEDDDE